MRARGSIVVRAVWVGRTEITHVRFRVRRKGAIHGTSEEVKRAV